MRRGALVHLRRAATVIAALIAVSACAIRAPERTAPPAALYDAAIIPGLPDARLWGDDLTEARRAAVARNLAEVERGRWLALGRPPQGVTTDVLAMSGGGPDGAFAAGLLTGWTEAGDRPEFTVVTGVSVGALIAPFAFAGPDYDPALRKIFTEFDTADVAELRIFAALRGALGVADTQPLRNQIRALADAALIARVAEGHRAGRRLLILTTNIDAARPVIWNMGAIAAAGETALFQDVMLASASIPGAFPPVSVAVTAGGESFTEFHVDGGVTRSVFVGPPGFYEDVPRSQPYPVRRTFHVIQNNALAPDYAPVRERLTAIASRSLSTLIRNQTDGDLARIYLAAQALGADFRLAFVPQRFQPASTAAFDRAYMTALFEAAAQMARDGQPWLDAPPAMLGRARLQAELSRRRAGG